MLHVYIGRYCCHIGSTALVRGMSGKDLLRYPGTYCLYHNKKLNHPVLNMIQVVCNCGTQIKRIVHTNCGFAFGSQTIALFRNSCFYIIKLNLSSHTHNHSLLLLQAHVACE